MRPKGGEAKRQTAASSVLLYSSFKVTPRPMALSQLSVLLTVEHAGQWKYRGEGAANVVVSYIGLENDLVGKVLRISKAAAATEKSSKLRASLQKDHFDLNAGGSDGSDRVEGSRKEVGPSPKSGSRVNPSALAAEDLPPQCQSTDTGGVNNLCSGPLVDHLKKRPNSELLELELSDRQPPLLELLEQEVWGKYPTLTGAKTGIELNHEYAKNVMGPLLGEDFVDAGVPVPAKEDFLIQLIANIEGSRPARWRQEGLLMLLSGWVLLVTDHTSPQTGKLKSGESQIGGGIPPSPSICLEIKPKAGFLPTSDSISPGNRVKLEKSRYELMQYLKTRQGKVDGISSYNPLDLFSFDRGRVRKAIDSLFDNPQNNLRVFVDGEAVTWSTNGDGGLQGIESALECVCAPVDGSRSDVIKELVVNRLAGSVILQKLRDTQMLDRHDIEGVIHVYRSLSGQTADEASVEHLPAATKQLLGLPREARLDILREFMVATTAKDCGLMLTFVPVEAGAGGEAKEGTTSNPVVQKLQGRCYMSKVGYVDLDLKRLKKIPKYWELDQQIVAAYNLGV